MKHMSRMALHGAGYKPACTWRFQELQKLENLAQLEEFQIGWMNIRRSIR